MTNSRILELLQIERECITRTNTCGHDCAHCELGQENWELLEMYNTLIKAYSQNKENTANADDYCAPDYY